MKPTPLPAWKKIPFGDDEAAAPVQKRLRSPNPAGDVDRDAAEDTAEGVARAEMPPYGPANLFSKHQSKIERDPATTGPGVSGETVQTGPGHFDSSFHWVEGPSRAMTREEEISRRFQEGMNDGRGTQLTAGDDDMLKDTNRA